MHSDKLLDGADGTRDRHTTDGPDPEKRERNFYSNQDYSYEARALAEGFKKGLREYYPDAQIVGEDLSQAFFDRLCPLIWTKNKSFGGGSDLYGGLVA